MPTVSLARSMMVMQVFVLVSRWQIDAPVDAVWDALADPAFTWPRWWPQLSADEVVASGGGRTAERWSRVRVRVRSPLGWSLRFGLVLESAHEPASGPPARPGRARLRASGDLVGTAEVVVGPPAAAHSEPHRGDDGEGADCGGADCGGADCGSEDRGGDDCGPTEVTLTWSVALARDDVVGRVVGRLPRWALTAAHGAVMRGGQRGLRAWLSRTSGATWHPPRSCATPP